MLFIKKIRFVPVLVSFLGPFLFPVTEVQSSECLQIATGITVNQKSFEQRLGLEFKQANVCVNLIYLPGKRSTEAMLDGRVDGELMRTLRYLKTLKGQAIAVPTPVARGGGVLVSSRKASVLLKNLSELKNIRVGVVSGTYWHTHLTKGFNRIISVGDIKRLIHQFRENRFKHFLIDSLSLKMFLDMKLLTLSELHVSPSLIDLSGYMLIRKSHKMLLPQLDAALQSAERKGLMSNIEVWK